MLLQTSPIDQPSESYSDQKSTKIGDEKPSTFTWWNPPSLTASMRHSRNQGWEALELPLVEPGCTHEMSLMSLNGGSEGEPELYLQKKNRVEDGKVFLKRHYFFGCVFV